MAYTVAGEQYRKVGGQLLEIHRQICQPGGYPFDPEGLSKHLQAGIEGGFRMPTVTIGSVNTTLTLSGTLMVPVDYGIKVEDALKASKKAGRLADFNTNIVRANFPPSYVGKLTIPMRLATFGREIGEFERRQVFAANRLIDLGATELNALNDAYPTEASIQDKLPIAACERFLLDAVGYWCWPCLDRDGRGRCVGLAWRGVLRGGWGGLWSFLVAS